MNRIVLYIIFSAIIFLPYASLSAQNISGEPIDVSSLSLTVLKFNSKITHYEFDDKENYAGQIRNSDNSFVIRVVGNSPANTNLYLSEGKRGHWFVVKYIGDSIDLNKVKLFNDYSDLKYVKKLVEQEQQQQDASLAKADNSASDNTKQSEKKKKEIADNAEKDSIAFAKSEQERLANAKAEQEKRKAAQDAALAQHTADSIQAQKAEEAKIAQAKQEEAERKNREALAVKAAHEKYTADSVAEAEKLAMLKEEVKRKQHTADSLKALNLKLAKEKHITDSIEKAAELAKIKEEADRNQHIADSLKALNAKIAREKAEAEQKRKAELAAEIAYQKHIADSLTQAEKSAKLKEKQAAAAEQKRIQDSVAAQPKVYTHVELWRKYPKFVFEQPPSGQSFAADYLNARDTLENYNISMLILNDRIADDALPEPIYSNKQNGASFVLKSINFSGVNCYMRILITNTNAKDDYLTGPITVQWKQKSGKDYNLYACYVTAYPVLSPHAEKEIVLVTRAVNIKNEDEITLHIGDRLENIDLGTVIPGKLYNQQYDIIRSLKDDVN